MATTTYLQAVNNVLLRLREEAVGSVQQNTYSQLIGQFVNDALRSVSDSYDWNSLVKDYTFNTVVGQSDYTLTGSGERFKVIDFLNTTQGFELTRQTRGWIDAQQHLTTAQNAAPFYYTFSGVDANGDTVVRLFPTPDAVYNLRLHSYTPQVALSGDADKITVPAEPVILAAFARAVVERGEDAGIQSSEAFMLASKALADAISLQATNNEEYSYWDVV